MTTLNRFGTINLTSNDFTWGFGSTYSEQVNLNFVGYMNINAPSALAVAAVSFTGANVRVVGNIESSATKGAMVVLPVPVPPGVTPPSGPVDELIAAGAVLGDARVDFFGNVHSRIEGGGAIGSFSALANATVNAVGNVVSDSGFAIRVQAAAGDALSNTTGLVRAGGGECAVMVEGRENGYAVNKAAILTTGDDVAGILVTGRVDLTFSGDRVAAISGSNAQAVNSGAIKTSGDGIRAEAQGSVEVRNTGVILSDSVGIHLRDVDGLDSTGVATVVTSGAVIGQQGGIMISGDFASSLVQVSGAVNGGSAQAIWSGASNDIIQLGTNAVCTGDVCTNEGNDVIELLGGAKVLGIIDSGAGNDTLRLGSAGGTITSGDGNDVIYAGQGKDVFSFAAGEFGEDLIFGFTVGEDRLVFETAPVEIRLEGDDTVVQLTGGLVRIDGFSSTDLGQLSGWLV